MNERPAGLLMGFRLIKSIAYPLSLFSKERLKGIYRLKISLADRNLIMLYKKGNLTI